jgi:hypothetical protein
MALFFFLIKRTKNQASKEASLRSGPLPGKTDKTAGCIILPQPRMSDAHGKKTLCPSRPHCPTCFISFHPKLFCWHFS